MTSTARLTVVALGLAGMMVGSRASEAGDDGVAAKAAFARLKSLEGNGRSPASTASPGPPRRRSSTR